MQLVDETTPVIVITTATTESRLNRSRRASSDSVHPLWHVGEAVTVTGEVTEALWEQHLSGRQGIGIIPIRDDSTCVFGAIDVAMFVLIIGGFLGVTMKTGAINAGIAGWCLS
jgi:uncharacterized ion transporter superfamily protein YfcC